MPNQMPYGFYNPNMNGSNFYENFQNNYDFNKLMELEERVKILEKKIQMIENNSNNSKDDYNYKYDYTTSIHMM